MRTCRALALFLAVSVGYAYGAGGGGGGGFGDISASPAAKPKTPAEISAGHYKAGVRHKERAWKQEAKAAAATSDKKRERALAKAQKEYKKAIDRQGKAIEAKTSNYEAANELGYALRKTGDFEMALQAYDLALTIAPDYYPAIEYRGEAYLSLGRFAEAQEAYMVLFNNEPELANQLMEAMQKWVQDNGETELSEEATAFKDWVEERLTLAQLTQAYGADGSRNW